MPENEMDAHTLAAIIGRDLWDNHATLIDDDGNAHTCVPESVDDAEIRVVINERRFVVRIEQED